MFSWLVNAGIHSRTLFLIVVLVRLMTPTLMSASQPWDEPFAPSAAAIAKAAAAIPPGDAGVVLLLEDHRFVIQKDGKISTTYRRVYRIVDAGEVEDWASIDQQWEPWHESRPQLRARAISPDGTEHWLDQKTIANAPVAQYDNTIYSDAKVLRAPIPGAAAGVVVEYEIVQHDTAPLFSAGIANALKVNSYLPLERFFVSIDAASGVDLRTGSTLIPSSAIRRQETPGGTHIEVELDRREAAKDLEFSVPADQPQYSEFRFSTAASWQTVAASYQKILDQQIKAGFSTTLLRDFGLGDGPKFTDLNQAAEKLTALLHRQVRYTGVEFGQGAIIPALPREVFQRHYGDCKDKAALLVALLRSYGFDAHLALLQAGESDDIDPQLPGFGLFNHAIVFIGGTNPLWIDATAENARVGSLPVSDQDRLALIVDEFTTSLTRTPSASSTENRVVHNVEIHLSESGNGEVHESLVASGSFETLLRSVYGGNEHEVRTAMERLGKNSFGGDSVGNYEVTRKDDFAKPFQLSVDVKNSAAAVTTLQQADVRLSNSFVFESLPYALSAAVNSGKGGSKTRKHDLLVRVPYHAEVHFKIFPPADFSPRQLPPPQRIDRPAMTYQISSKRNQDGTILVDYEFELKKTRLRPEEVEDVQGVLKKPLEDGSHLVSCAYRGADLIALGKTAEALQISQRSAREHPESALVQMRFSQILASAGAGQAALTAARRAVELDPKSARAWLLLAYAYEHDSFGRLRAGDWNPLEAEKALRKSQELDAVNIESKVELAILLEHNATGERYSRGARMNAAVNVYKAILKDAPNAAITQNLVIALMHMGQFKEAQETIESAGQKPVDASLGISLMAVNESPERAIISHEGTFQDNQVKAQTIAQAGLTLSQLRQYAAGAELIRAAQRFSNQPQFGQMLRLFSSAQPYEKALGDDDDPRTPVKKFLVLAAKDTATREELAELISNRADAAAWQGRLEQTRSNLGQLRLIMRTNGGNGDSLADLVIAHSKIERSPETKTLPQSDSGKGVSVIVQRFSISGGTSDQPAPASLVTVTSELNYGLLTFVVVQENGRAKILATGDGLDTVGKIALDALSKGDLKTAQAWLDVAKDNALPISPRDDKGPAFRYLWAGTVPETRNVAFAKATSASLLGTYSGSSQAIAVLREISNHPPQYMEREDLNFALCEALQKAGNWKDLAKASDELFKSRSYQEAAMNFKGEALIALEDWPGLTKASEARLAISAKEHSALQFAAIAALMRGDHAGASAYAKRSKESMHSAYLTDETLEQWIAIFGGKVPDELSSQSDFGNTGAILFKGTAYAYTHALLQLRNGQPEECQRNLILAMQADLSEPSGLAWLVQAELLKQYSLDESATAAFQKARLAGRFDRLAFARKLIPQ